jgi:hypothetical protein
MQEEGQARGGGEGRQEFVSVDKLYEQYRLKKMLYLQNMNNFSSFKSKLSREAVPEEKERIRRSRKDKEGRNFRCGCAKTYLSYPALYTHIKTKHGGKEPQGTTRSVVNGSKRGRPKRDNLKDEEHSKGEDPLNEAEEECANFFENAVDRAALDMLAEHREYAEGETEFAVAQELIGERRWILWI